MGSMFFSVSLFVFCPFVVVVMMVIVIDIIVIITMETSLSLTAMVKVRTLRKTAMVHWDCWNSGISIWVYVPFRTVSYSLVAGCLTFQQDANISQGRLFLL